MSAPLRPGLSALAPYLVLLGEVLVFYRQVLFSPDLAIPYDLQGYHLPLAHFAAKSLGAGQLPLWDPYTYCGFPFFANIQAQLFYPPAWITFLAANLLGFTHLVKILEWQVALHVFLGGVFTYQLLRRLEAGRAAATFGATVFQLGAFFSSQAQRTSDEGHCPVASRILAIVALNCASRSSYVSNFVSFEPRLYDRR